MMPREGNGDWGNQVWLLPSSVKLNIYDIYENPMGEKWGVLSSDGTGTLKIEVSPGKALRVNHEDLAYIGHFGHVYIKAKPSHNPDYLKVFWHTRGGGFFVRKKDLTAFELDRFTYRDLLKQKMRHAQVEGHRIGGVPVGVNLDKRCLNLRESPSPTSATIVCMPGNQWDTHNVIHLNILEMDGDWARVEAIWTVADDACDALKGCPCQETNRQRGWVKAIGDNGFPNIWFAVTSY
ncbi:MAG: hypothetical protein AAFW00_14890 [Bacteroidota bacterium]